jgi:hypothetical protein
MKAMRENWADWLLLVFVVLVMILGARLALTHPCVLGFGQ